MEYAEAYRRVRPNSDSAELLKRWRQGVVNIVLVNSAESLRNLVQMLGKAGAPLLSGTQLLVVSERMLALTEELGFQYPVGMDVNVQCVALCPDGETLVAGDGAGNVYCVHYVGPGG